MNIEAFNNDQDFGAPLNVEGFVDATCSTLTEDGCKTHSDECAWDGSSCGDKPAPVETGTADANSSPSAEPLDCDKVKACMANPGTDSVDTFSDYDYENFNGDESTDVVANEPANNSNGQLVNVDLLLRSLVYGCVFYILAHPESLALVKKCCQQVVKKISGDNVLLVQMGLFVVVYYVLSMFI